MDDKIFDELCSETVLSSKVIDAGAEMLRGYDLDNDLPAEVAERVFREMIAEIRDQQKKTTKR